MRLQRGLAARSTKLSALAVSEEVRENVAIQAQFSDFFVDALENERTRHHVIREASTRLSLAIDLAKYSEKVLKKTRREGVRFRIRRMAARGKRKIPLSWRGLGEVWVGGVRIIGRPTLIEESSL